jgi:hypothetical protein
VRWQPQHSRAPHPREGWLDLLAAGATHEEILADYPYLEAEDITAVLEFAGQ